MNVRKVGGLMILCILIFAGKEKLLFDIISEAYLNLYWLRLSIELIFTLCFILVLLFSSLSLLKILSPKYYEIVMTLLKRRI